jgi:DNA mismatch repair protein MutS2
MEHLVDIGATAIVTTHFGALKAFADETAGVANGAMMFDRDSLSPTYVFEPGIPGSSFAFQIAERTSFPPSILSRAQELAGSEESRMEDLLAGLELAKRRAVEEEALLTKRLTEAEDAALKARDARQRIAESRDKILATAEQEAESLLKKANRTIERTVREIREAQAERKRTVKAREQITELRVKIKAKAETRKRRRPADPKPTKPAGRLARGDQVILDSGEAVGEVESIDQEFVIVTFGSMQTRVASSRLTRVGGPKRQEVQVSQARSTTATDGGLPAVRQRHDVRGYRVAEAIPEVEKFIDAAVRAGLRRVEILHGTGTGALRMALQEHLKSLNEVDHVSDAPIEQGGAGVSIVILR